MVTTGWARFEGGDAAWDALVSALGAPIFQTSAWAAHKAAAGWSPVRAACLDADGRPRAAVQALRRAKGPAALLWARGGPVGDPALWDEPMRRALAAGSGKRLSYLRVCPYVETSPALEGGLASGGWSRPARPLDRNASFVLDLTPEPAALEAGLSNNWAHNLRRALKRCAPARLWERPDPAQVSALYRSAEAYKGLAEQHSDAALASMTSALSASLLVFRVDAPDGAPLALRAAAVSGTRAWDLWAAASPEGRKVYASYGAFWALALACRARGARDYDLGGADPALAKGVFDFKRGTGARPVQYLGEWDWAAPSALRAVADRAVGWLAKGAA